MTNKNICAISHLLNQIGKGLIISYRKELEKLRDGAKAG